MNEPLLAIDDLEVRYGGVEALRGASIRVARGEIVALLGANGAGKSTTLRAISGLVRPRRGTIRFDGRPITGRAPHEIAAAGIAHVPEGRRLFTRMTVRENLMLGAGGRLSQAEIRARIERVLEIFPQLRDRLGQRAATLSGGEQQMVAIGRALMAQPRLWLLDEPSLGLSPVLVKHVFETLRAIRDTGATMLLVEQNAGMALRLAARAYLLENGRVVREDTADRLRGDPAVIEAYLGGAAPHDGTP